MVSIGRSIVLRVFFAFSLVLMSASATAVMAQEVPSETTTPTGVETTDSESVDSSTPAELGADEAPAEDTQNPEGNTGDDVDTSAGSQDEGVQENEGTTEPAGTEGGTMAPMALDPETGSMVSPTSVHIAFPAGATFEDLAVVSVVLGDIEEGTCQQGSPRFAFGLADGEGESLGYVFGHLVDVPGWAGCDGPFSEGANLVGTTEGRWELGQANADGDVYTTWADAVTRVGEYSITEAMLVLDAGGSLTPTNITVQFKTPAQELLGDVIVNVDFDATPEDQVCFELVAVDGPVVGTRCLAPGDLNGDAAGAVTFNGVAAGTYTVRESTAPAGFDITPDSRTVEVTSGLNSSVSFTAVSASVVTINLTSANPAEADTLPEGATWSVALADNPDEELFGATFAEEHRDLSEGQAIPVNNPVPFGTYVITVDAGPDFHPFSMDVELDEAQETVDVELAPVTLVDQLVAILIQILEEILAGETSGE